MQNNPMQEAMLLLQVMGLGGSDMPSLIRRGLTYQTTYNQTERKLENAK